MCYECSVSVVTGDIWSLIDLFKDILFDFVYHGITLYRFIWVNSLDQFPQVADSHINMLKRGVRALLEISNVSRISSIAFVYHDITLHILVIGIITSTNSLLK